MEAIPTRRILQKEKKKSLMFVYGLCAFVSGLVLFLDSFWFDDLRAGLKKRERERD